jgi:ABC-type nickel/cobalt efflux system permease component RcnA
MIDPVHLTTLIGVGFVLGLRHAFEPDHLAAVSTLAARPGGLRNSVWSSVWLGTAWGVGHTLSVGFALALLLLLGLRLPEALHRVAEMGVAVLLVVLGVVTWRAHVGGSIRGEAGGEADGESDEADAAAAKPQRGVRQSFGFGLIHGLAGSGALVVILATTAGSGMEQLAYFLPFGLGTVGGMLVVSTATYGLARLAARRRLRHGRDWPRRLRLATALLSIAIGCWLGLETVGWIA